LADLNDKIKRVNRAIGQLIKQHEREIARKYAKVLLLIRAELAKNYEKYEQGGQLTLQEMLKHDRLKKMMRQIEFLMSKHYKDIAKDIEKALGGMYQEGYYMSAWAVETSAKASIGFSALRPESLTAMLNNPINGLTLKARLQQRRARIIQAIQNQVTQGLQKNESYATMAKRLKGELEGDAVKSMRIVRTEGHRVQESAKHDAMDFANGNGVIMAKQWNTLEDERVRRRPNDKADHKKLNNKKVPMSGTFNDGLSEGPAPGQLGSAASDINCRCFLTYSIEKLEKKEVKDLEKLTFDQWKKERLKA
jgi:hypothetical protein